MKVVGLDLSLTCSGICVMTPTSIGTYAVTTKADAGRYARLIEITDEIRSYLFRADLVVVEELPVGGRNMTSVVRIAELHGVIGTQLLALDIPTARVAPTLLKKFVTGKGNAKKDELRLAIFKKWDFEAKTADECEAYALAMMGRMYLTGEVPTTIPAREAMAKVEWPKLIGG